jgi:hypothetical protein
VPVGEEALRLLRLVDIIANERAALHPHCRTRTRSFSPPSARLQRSRVSWETARTARPLKKEAKMAQEKQRITSTRRTAARVSVTRGLAVLIAAIASMFALSATPAGAVTYKPVDVNDHPLPTGCWPDPCSLRDAVVRSEANSTADTIVLGQGRYVLSLPIAGTDDAYTGDLDITKELTIVGQGAGKTVIDANWVDRAIDIVFGAKVHISGVTIRNGYARLDGHATNHGHGGGIHNHGELTLENSTIGYSSPLDLSLQSNAKLWGGGGLTNANKATLNNVTIAQNTIWSGKVNGVDWGFGAGIENIGPKLDLVNVTVANNFVIGYPLGTAIPAGHGGGIGKVAGTATLKNTIVADNDSGNCAGTIASAGRNFDSDGTCNLTGVGDQRPATGQWYLDPKFGTPLRDAANYIWLYPLLATSPAVDKVPTADCPLSVDEVGTGRPQGVACDIGAFEFVPSGRVSNLYLKLAKYPLKIWFGDGLAYTFFVANEGAAAEDVVLEYAIPDGAELLDVSEGCEGGTTVTCKLGALEEGATAEVTIVVMPTSPGLARSEAVVSSATPDENEEDNRAVAETEVVAE